MHYLLMMYLPFLPYCVTFVKLSYYLILSFHIW